MAYIAQKPCRFAGQSFRVGEIVPADVMQPGAIRNLVKMGIISEEGVELLTASVETREEPKISITVLAGEDTMELNPTPEGLQSVFDVLTGNTTEAEATINAMTDVDALILLDLSDARKTVKGLTKSRAEALSAAQ